MFWHSGLEGAPRVVHLAKLSWEKLNPDYEVRFLDHQSLEHYVDLGALIPDWQRLPIQKQANLLRLELLRIHGGVWADATLVCLQPLQSWLPRILDSGFFAFRKRNSPKIISNFFLASSGDHVFISRWLASFQGFMAPIPRRMHKKVFRAFVSFFPDPKSPWPYLLFTCKVMRNRFGFPYFIAHYLANRLILLSPKMREIWRKSPQLDYLGLPQLLGSTDPESALISAISKGSPPVVKLSHHLDPRQNKSFSQIISHLELYVSDYKQV